MVDEGLKILREHFNSAFTDSDVAFFKSLSLSDMATFLKIVRKQIVERHVKLRERSKHPGRRWHRIRQLMAKLPEEEALVARIDNWFIRYNEDHRISS